MIHLDTNYVIGLVSTPSLFDSRFLAWFNAQERFAASAIAWSEFLNGPVTLKQVQDATNMIESRVIPFGVAEAEIASMLFNETGRKRGSQPDCHIAATAISSSARLATDNRRDFLPFVSHGLRLA